MSVLLDVHLSSAYHGCMEFLSSVSTAAVFVLVVLVIVIIAIALFLRKRALNKQTQSDTSVDIQTEKPINVSPTPVKSADTKYLILIIAGSILAIIIPLITLLIIKSQPATTTQSSNERTAGPLCRAITITDTLNNPLSQEVLSTLQPGDEVKILIATDGTTVEKARFRINGSQWQEVTIKSGNNFVANYILDSGVKKFTVEAEVYDKVKGWL